MKQTIGSLLQYYRKQNKMTQSELAIRLGECGYPVKNGAVSSWEKDNSQPNASQFLAICRILGITDIYGVFVGLCRKIPLRLMGVSAGTGEYVGDSEAVDEYLETTNELADFALRINGDSMEPLYWDNDVVLVQSTEVLANGDVGIFYLDGEQYCKRLRGNKLVSENSKYAPIDINNSDYFKILGKVLGRYDNGREMDG